VPATPQAHSFEAVKAIRFENVSKLYRIGAQRADAYATFVRKLVDL
jgi:hypothetical protein